jgi:hypothetical protein
MPVEPSPDEHPAATRHTAATSVTVTFFLDTTESYRRSVQVLRTRTNTGSLIRPASALPARRVVEIRPPYRHPRKTTFVRENQTAIQVAVGPESWHCSRTETGQPGSATEGQPEVDVVRENRGRRKLEADPSAVSRQRAAMTTDVTRKRKAQAGCSRDRVKPGAVQETISEPATASEVRKRTSRKAAPSGAGAKAPPPQAHASGGARRYRCGFRFASISAGGNVGGEPDRRSKDRKERHENTPRGLRLPWGFSRPARVRFAGCSLPGHVAGLILTRKFHSLIGP